MKVLTVWQPWASLIAIGAKSFEFRGWEAPPAIVGQRIGIHAGSRKVKLTEVDELIDLIKCEPWRVCLDAEVALPFLQQAFAHAESLPLSAILCTAVLGQPANGFDVAAQFGGNDSNRGEHANFAWPLTQVEMVMPPVEARGAQGFWTYGGAL